MSTTEQQPEKPCAAEAGEGRATPAERILARSQDSRPEIQGFVVLARSLEWQLGQTYLKDRGSASFTSDSFPVPWVVNNDGGLSRRAAEVFFQSISDREQEIGDREQGAEPIYVLELGVGVGLFARYFLDYFKELCRKHDRDYYDRLCYILADKSPRMLYDVARHGILAGHAGRYRLRVVDALKVDERLPFDACFQGRGASHAFFFGGDPQLPTGLFAGGRSRRQR